MVLMWKLQNVLIETALLMWAMMASIKSGRDEEDRKKKCTDRNVIVRNCLVYHAHGGFVIGSEMGGGVRTCM